MSECVARHASAFRREWPVLEREREPYALPEPSPKTARPIGRDELGDARSKRTQAVKAAEAAGWAWVAHAADSPSEPGASSVVIRFRLPGSLPWTCRRVAAYWRARPEQALAFVAAFAWREHGDGLRTEERRLDGQELTRYLRELPAELRERAGKGPAKYTRARV